jgi:hypothetical protein
MGWEQLKTIRDENARLREQEAREPPVACPIDGSLLDMRTDGTRNCPMGNFRWNGV